MMFACYRTFVENCSSQTFEMLGGVYQSDPTPTLLFTTRIKIARINAQKYSSHR